MKRPGPHAVTLAPPKGTSHDAVPHPAETHKKVAAQAVAMSKQPEAATAPPGTSGSQNSAPQASTPAPKKKSMNMFEEYMLNHAKAPIHHKNRRFRMQVRKWLYTDDS